MKKFSIVIPIYNEYENIKSLHTEIINSTKYIKNTEFEIIFIDDASIDGSKELLKEIKKKHNIKLIHNLRNLGQSKSISIGIKSSSHPDIITIDVFNFIFYILSSHDIYIYEIISFIF